MQKHWTYSFHLVISSEFVKCLTNCTSRYHSWRPNKIPTWLSSELVTKILYSYSHTWIYFRNFFIWGNLFIFCHKGVKFAFYYRWYPYQVKLPTGVENSRLDETQKYKDLKNSRSSKPIDIPSFGHLASIGSVYIHQLESRRLQICLPAPLLRSN